MKLSDLFIPFIFTGLLSLLYDIGCPLKNTDQADIENLQNVCLHNDVSGPCEMDTTKVHPHNHDGEYQNACKECERVWLMFFYIKIFMQECNHDDKDGNHGYCQTIDNNQLYEERLILKYGTAKKMKQQIPEWSKAYDANEYASYGDMQLIPGDKRFHSSKIINHQQYEQTDKH